jgi:hypothetical protein
MAGQFLKEYPVLVQQLITLPVKELLSHQLGINDILGESEFVQSGHENPGLAWYKTLVQAQNPTLTDKSPQATMILETFTDRLIENSITHDEERNPIIDIKPSRYLFIGEEQTNKINTIAGNIQKIKPEVTVRLWEGNGYKTFSSYMYPGNTDSHTIKEIEERERAIASALKVHIANYLISLIADQSQLIYGRNHN